MNHRSSALNFFLGMVTVFVAHVLGAFILYCLAALIPMPAWLATLIFVSVFGIGIAQVVYVVPLCLWLRKRRLYPTMKGVVTGAVITFLLNGGCFLVFATG